MNLETLRQAIQAESIREDAYVLLGEAEERYCLTHNNPWWSVFYARYALRRATVRA